MSDWCSNTFLPRHLIRRRIEEMLEEVKNIARHKGSARTRDHRGHRSCAVPMEGYVERAYRFLSMMDSRGLEPLQHTQRRIRRLVFARGLRRSRVGGVHASHASWTQARRRDAVVSRHRFERGVHESRSRRS